MRDQGTAQLVARGEAATAAGLDPRVGDVVLMDAHAPARHRSAAWVVGHVGESIRDEDGDMIGTRERWAELCRDHGYLMERGEVSNGQT